MSFKVIQIGVKRNRLALVEKIHRKIAEYDGAACDALSAFVTESA